MPELVQFWDAGGPETVRYHFLAPLLLNELQKQQRMIELQREQSEKQQRTIEALEQRLAALEKGAATQTH